MTEVPATPASVLIADAASKGVELSAEVQTALHTLESCPDIRVFTPWSHALCVVVDPDGAYTVHTMSGSSEWTGDVLAQIASRWFAVQVLGGETE